MPVVSTVYTSQGLKSFDLRGGTSALPWCVFRSELRVVGQCQADECSVQERAV